MNVAHGLLLAALAALVEGARVRDGKERPVMKIVRMLEDMKVQLEKEKADDEQVYKSLSCWCEENDKEKSAAIEAGKAQMADLKAAMGEYAARIEELRVSLAETKGQLRQDQKALDSATAIRTQESQAFHLEEKELLDTIQACKQALIVLSKHHPSLTQLHSVAKSLEAVRTMRMAKDTLSRDKLAVLKAFVQQAEDTSGSLRRIPGFQSYTPQSGQIFGILKQMQEEFESDLSTAQKQELKAREDFASLKAAKEAELVAGRKKQAQLEQDDADFREKDAQAYKELNDTREQVEVDEMFLFNLKKRCSETESEFQARTKSRMEEIAAVQETLAFLNTDEAFNVFDKAVNTPSAFLQTGSVQDSALRRRAAQALLSSGSPRLALLSASVRLDAFTKVKEAIDKMVTELSLQQREEVEHRDWCLDELGKNERSTAEQSDKRDNLEADIASGKKTVEDLSQEIEAKTAAIAEMQAEMKKASEVREAENADFQETITDHQISQAILQKALERMRRVYALAQVGEPDDQPGAPHVQLSANATDPGNGPARFTAYGKSAKGGRVVALLEQVLEDSKSTEMEAHKAELDAQSAYESFMKDSNASIKRYQQSIVNLSDGKAKAEQALVLSESDLKDTMKELTGLEGSLSDLKASCDFLLKNFEARQEARTTEIEALREAKAILSGME